MHLVNRLCLCRRVYLSAQDLSSCPHTHYVKLHSELVKHAVSAGITSLIAKAGQLKWVMKLDISWPKAVSIFRLSWSLPTVATDNTCLHYAEGDYIRLSECMHMTALTPDQGFRCGLHCIPWARL